MYLNFQELEQAPELIDNILLSKIMGRSVSTAGLFIRKYKIKAVQKGKKKMVVKSDLLAFLSRNNWLPSGWGK